MVNEIKLHSSFLTPAEDRQLPCVLAADTVEDYAAGVALTLRQQSSISWLPVLLPRGSRLPQLDRETRSMHAYVGTSDLIPTSEWVSFQRLWLRWQAPLDYVAPMRWYLTAAWPSIRPPTELTETVDQCMQELDTLPPSSRLYYIGRLLHLPETKSAVIGWGDWQWALPSMLHASLIRKPFVWCKTREELLEIAASDLAELSFCIPLHQLDLDLLNQLVDTRSFHLDIQRVRDINFSERPFGFFTARTLEIFSRLPVKHHLYRHTPLERSAWILTGEMPGKVTDPDVTLLTREEASVAHLELIDRPEMLVLDGHSREDLFHLGSDALCGMSSEAPLNNSSGPLPACIHDGHCVKDGAVLPVTRLSAKVLLMAGCNLMRLGGRGSFAPEYTLAFSCLEGACNAVVASRRTRFGHVVEQIFMYQLIRAGMTIGEAVRLVNNSLPFSGPESPDYLVLGEGDWAPFTPTENKAHLDIASEGNGWRVECRDVDAQYVEVRLPSFTAELYVRPLGTTAKLEEILYSVAPESDGTCRVFLFSWHRLQADRYSFWIGPKTDLVPQQEALATSYRNRAYDRLFHSYLPKFENWEKELHSLSAYIARHLNEANYLSNACGEAEAKAAEAEALLSRMDQALCSFLLDRIAKSAFVWLDQYMEVDGCFLIAEHLPRDQYCPYCTSPIVRKIIRHRYDRATAREFALCQACGNVWDTPLPGINPVFKGAALLARNTKQAYAVVVRNTLGRRVRGWLGFRIYQAEKYGVMVKPPLREVVLEAGEEAEVPFEINVDRHMVAHMEFARGFWVSELSVSVFQRNIWVVPG